MMEYIMKSIKDWKDEDEVRDLLFKLLKKKIFDRKGLIYGIGHAVYTLSDPRAIILREKAAKLAAAKKQSAEYELYRMVERIGVEELSALKPGLSFSANVDFYSGFVYEMLNIPRELYVPIFAVSRIAGWSAHRIQELVSGGKIIRPAYKSISERRLYIPLVKREKTIESELA
jgi:citrate synthase